MRTYVTLFILALIAVSGVLWLGTTDALAQERTVTIHELPSNFEGRTLVFGPCTKDDIAPPYTVVGEVANEGTPGAYVLVTINGKQVIPNPDNTRSSELDPPIPADILAANAQNWAERIQKRLDKGFAFVFSQQSGVPMQTVHPRVYEKLVQEIELARNAEKDTIASTVWEVLSVKTAQAISDMQAGEGE